MPATSLIVHNRQTWQEGNCILAFNVAHEDTNVKIRDPYTKLVKSVKICDLTLIRFLMMELFS